MERRRLGKTDIEISPIGLGTWQFSRGGGPMGGVWGELSQETADAIVGAAIKGGIDWFDTAEVYGMGLSEKTLSAALGHSKAAPGSVKIATKWFPLMRRAKSIGATIERRLANLAPYPIDLYQIHLPLSLSSIPKQMEAMAAILREGKVRAIGVSNFSAAQMELAHSVLASEGIPLASNQVRASLLDRSIESKGTLETALRLGITLIAYSPLAQGVLSGKFHDNPDGMKNASAMRRMSRNLSPKGLAESAPLVAELKAIAAARGASPSQISLAWLLGYYGASLVAIPGATKPEQASSIAESMEIVLSEKELGRLEELSRRYSQ